MVQVTKFGCMYRFLSMRRASALSRKVPLSNIRFWPTAVAPERPLLADSDRFLGSNDGSGRLPMSEADVDIGQL